MQHTIFWKKCVLVGTFFVQRKPKHFVKSLLLSCVCVFSSFIFFTFLIYKYMNSISKIYRILYCVFFSVLFLTCVFASLLSFPLFSVLYIHCAVISLQNLYRLQSSRYLKLLWSVVLFSVASNIIVFFFFFQTNFIYWSQLTIRYITNSMLYC